MNNIPQPLALANEAFGEQRSWQRNQELIDALPYIDSLEPAEKQAVMAVIEEEVRFYNHVTGVLNRKSAN
jgi:hypothetical protein